MPPVARKNGTEPVNTVHVATGDADTEDSSFCDVAPIITATAAGSGNVFANSIGVVRLGDAVAPHPIGGTCSPHSPGLAAGSGTVFANGKNIGRLGDTYGCGAVILSGSGNVFAGG